MRGMTFRHARLAAFGSTRHRANRVEDDPNIQACCRRRDSRHDDLRKELAAPRDRRARRLAGREPGDDRRLGRAPHSAGREVIYDAEHFFDGYKADPAYALATLRTAVDAGATTVVLCDTNGGCLTEEVAAMTRNVVPRSALGVTIGIHVHDDAGLAVANSLAAVQAGANHVQGTINGYGERCGNANLVTIWANLALKLGLPTVPAGDDLTACRSCPLRGRGGQHRARRPRARTSARAHSRTRAASTAPRRCASSRPTSTSTRPSSAARRASWSASSAAAPTPRGGSISSAARGRGHRSRRDVAPGQAARGGGGQLRGRRCVLRAPGPPAASPTTRPRSGSSTSPSSSSAATGGAARRGEREGRGRR